MLQKQIVFSGSLLLQDNFILWLVCCSGVTEHEHCVKHTCSEFEKEVGGLGRGS